MFKEAPPSEAQTCQDRPWGPVHALAFGAGLAPTLAILAPLGMAPLFILVSLAALGLGWREQPWRHVDPLLGGIVLALALWGGLSTLWALDPTHTLRTALVFAAQGAAGLLLTALARQLPEAQSFMLGRALGVGVGLALLLLAVEVFTPGIIHLVMQSEAFLPRYDQLARFNRGQTVAPLLAFPALLALWRNGDRRFALVLAVAAAIVILASRPLAARLGLVAGGLVFAATLARPLAASRAVAAILAALILAAPAFALLPPAQQSFDTMRWLPSSAHHRLTIWNFAGQKTLERPWLGWGMDAARDMPGGEEELTVFTSVDPPRHYIEQLMPLHPHNAAAQVWMELGLPGALLMAGLTAALALRIGRFQRLDAAMAMATLSATVLVALVSFGIWQSWWQCTFLLAAALLAGNVGRPRRADSGAR